MRPPADLAQAESVYLLWGELRADDPSRIVALRREVPRDPGPEIWLVVRAERLDWQDGAYRQLLEQAERWRRAGNPLAGVQIDFDAATLRLGTYAAFLRDLRRRPGYAALLAANDDAPRHRHAHRVEELFRFVLEHHHGGICLLQWADCTATIRERDYANKQCKVILIQLMLMGAP